VKSGRLIASLFAAIWLTGCAALGELAFAFSARTSAEAAQQNEIQEATVNVMDDLKERLYSTDQNISSKALGELVRRGRQATPILLEALQHSNARTRRLAAEGLAEIADPSTADALFEATTDSNGEVRSRAAAALHRLGDERALQALVATLNDYPDVLHSPYTASMYPLMRGGEAVLPLIIPLLSSPDELTRQRAFLVLEAVVTALPETNWDQLRQSLGNYDPTGPEAERNQAAQQWQDWLAHR
jgi:HEAT repeat protein